MQISDYLLYKIKATLKAQAAKNYLSYLWWIFEPILLMGVFYLVFGILFQRGGEGFELFLLVGISTWLWFANSVTTAMLSIEAARGIIQQVYIPKVIIPLVPLVPLGVAIFKQAIVFSLLLLFLIVSGKFSEQWVFFPLAVLTQILLNVAIAMIAAAFVPFLPDMQFIIAPGLQALMFCSGVFYTVDRFPENIQALFCMTSVLTCLPVIL